MVCLGLHHELGRELGLALALERGLALALALALARVLALGLGLDHKEEQGQVPVLGIQQDQPRLNACPGCRRTSSPGTGGKS